MKHLQMQLLLLSLMLDESVLALLQTHQFHFLLIQQELNLVMERFKQPLLLLAQQD
jgi:hypothetical protein